MSEDLKTRLQKAQKHLKYAEENWCDNDPRRLQLVEDVKALKETLGQEPEKQVTKKSKKGKK